MKARSFFYYGKFIVMGLAAMILFTYVVMLLWNWLVPELFNGPLLTYWQTLGILVLAKILLSGMGSGHRRSHANSRKGDWNCHPPHSSSHRDYWKKKFEEKMNGKVEKEEQKFHEKQKYEG